MSTLWTTLAISLLTVSSAFSQSYILGASDAPSTGLTFFLEEDFEGSNDGCDLVWGWTTNSGPNVIDTDEQIIVQTGTDSMRFDNGAASESDDYISRNHGSQMPAVHYGRIYVYIDSANTPDNDEINLITSSGTSPGAYHYRMNFGEFSSAGYAEAIIAGASQQSGTISLDTWVRIEWLYDSTAGTFDWKINGTSQTQVSGGTTGNQPTYLHLYNTTVAEGYFDDLKLSEDDWIGAN